MLRILWYGDGGCTTGFGRVTHEICSRLGQLYDVHILALNYKGDPDEPYASAPYKLYNPTAHDSMDGYGFNRLPELLQKLRPDILVIVNDVPIIEQIYVALQPSIEAGLKMPATIIYTPIDAVNLPPDWGTVVNRADEIITYTKFAVGELSEVTDRNLRIAYHGIDHDMHLEKVSRETPVVVTTDYGVEVECYSKEEIKQAFGLQDNFIILWADRNSTRKYTPGFFKAVERFVKRHDDVIVWMHCAENDQGGNLASFTEKYNLHGRVYKTPNLDTFVGVTDAYMNVLYNMADVKVSTTLGEGAGLTNMEAARVGVPVILPSFSANEEMIGAGGLYVSSKFLYTTPRGCDFSFPDTDEYDVYLERLYNDKQYRDEIGELGINHVSQFTWDDAVEVFRAAFVPALQTAYERNNSDGMV